MARTIDAQSFAVFVEGSLIIQGYGIEGSFGFAVKVVPAGQVEIAATITRIDLGDLVIEQTIAATMLLVRMELLSR